MFTLNSEMWNDGPALPNFMGREGAPRIATRHLCSGGGDGPTGEGPDYSQYINRMTEIGQTGLDRSQNLFDWATKAGVDLSDIARSLGTKATAASDRQQGASDDLMDDWQRIYKPLYEAQSADAQRMYGDMPAYQEQQAGRGAADAAMAIDQGMQTQMRNMRAQGFNPNAVNMGAIGATAATGRALATTAAAQQGRDLAKQETRQTGQAALQSGQFLPGVSGQQASLASGNRAQGGTLPAQAIQTTTGAHSAGMGYYNAAMPYFKEWGNATEQKEMADLKRQQIANESGSGGEIGQMLGMGVGAGLGFWAGGPMGAKAGAGIGSSLGGGAGEMFSEGGRARGRRYAAGGAIDTAPPMGNLVPPEASPSGGAEVDDVHAMVSEGEFVIPKRTVDWLGDKFFQKLIQKTDQEIEQDTTAAPEEGPATAEMEPPPVPAFRSEGARV